jgi:anti-sigma28 factor (negative regulator of flagellin synthesis)
VSDHEEKSHAPLPITSKAVMERRHYVADIRDRVRKGEYQVPADKVAEAVLKSLHRRPPPDTPTASR